MTVFPQEQKGMESAHEDAPAKSDYHGFEWPVSSEGFDIVKWLEENQMRNLTRAECIRVKC